LSHNKLAVSVIVPAYNRGDVIQRALHSLLAQDFQQEYEVIVIDDGSTDDTVSKVVELQAEYPQIHLVEQQNQGASAARRAGILAAQANVIAFLDSDDVSETHHLSTLWNALHQHDSLVLAYALVSDLDGKLIAEQSVPEVAEDGLLLDPLLALIKMGCFTYSMNFMTYRQHAIDASAGREHILAANDYDLCLRLALKGPFIFVPRVTLNIDRRGDGIGSKFGYRQVSFAVFVALDAFKLSGRKDVALLAALKSRIQMLWPTACGQLLAKAQYRNAFRILAIGLRFGSLKNIKDLYWSIDHYCTNKRN
jgi:glycosyltransferase involved in cell wall biosynthesis